LNLSFSIGIALESEKPKTHCIRCGECCIKSSPTLQTEDLLQVTKGLIPTHDLYTIRTGELVRDNIQNELKINENELIKLREKDPGKGCLYYDEKDRACRIYKHRPVQCSAQVCWDDSKYLETYKGPKLTRKEIIQDNILLGLMDQHEKKCSYRVLEKLVRQIETQGAKAVEDLVELLRFDHELRPFVSEKMGLAFNDMDLIFGRPLTETITMFGLRVVQEPDGSFYFTVEEPL
jgi:Fe-S-cluster containining protein